MDIIEMIQGLKKRANISVDTEATKVRSREAWKNLSNAQKQEVLALAEVGKAVAHNTYKNGHLGAPVAIAMAKAAGMNPAYLAGMTDKQGRFTEKNLYAFLSSLGYDFEDDTSAESAGLKPDTEVDEPAAAETDIVPSDAPCCECDASCVDAGEPEAMPALPDDDLYLLLKALLIKAQVSSAAKKTLAEIQELLIR